MPFAIKRIYAPASSLDGKRVLVDRLWPRGISKVRAALDDWMKEIAPSPELRIWFDHREDRMAEFVKQYRQELDTQPEKQQAAAKLLDMAREGKVTLLYGAHDPEINHAKPLMAWLEEKLAQEA